MMLLNPFIPKLDLERVDLTKSSSWDNFWSSCIVNHLKQIDEKVSDPKVIQAERLLEGTLNST